MKTEITECSLKVFMLLRSHVKLSEVGSNFNGGCVCVCAVKFEDIYIITELSEVLRELSCVIML